MATCDVQAILDDARCFYALNPAMLRAVTAQLWCNVAEGLSNLVSDNPAIQNIDDLEWYRFNATELAPDTAIPNIGQVPVDPGPNAYLVILNLTDGLKYKLRLSGTPPAVFWDIDNTPTLEAETPTTIFAGGNDYSLDIITDGGLTVTLTPIP
jgi:hypothetical protein